ncbi:MAG: GvpL/GvpF family gas vesicle protein [Halanaerobiales bacterium]|nr:GvpL/GvpF family gas vesicle protein [Halanaerobiales bacterium]
MKKIYAYAICNLKEEQGKTKTVFKVNQHKIISIPFKKIALMGENIEKSNIEIGIENLFTHEKIVEKIWEKTSILPVQFGTILKNKKAVKNILQEYYSQFRNKLQELANKTELGVKIFIPKKENTNTNTTHNIFEKKSKNNEENKGTENHTYSLFSQTHNKLLKISIKGKYTVDQDEEHLIYDGSYLIPEANITSFKEVIKKIDTKFPEFQFSLTGPWPPYNFCKLESKPFRKKGGG